MPAHSDEKERRVKTKRRFVAKQRGDGTWGVYDTERGSWPALLGAPIGRVKQDHAVEGLADKEAMRLEEELNA